MISLNICPPGLPCKEIWSNLEMGIFDRLRSAAPPPGGDARPDASGQDATRLIDEGHALEAQDRLDEAMQCYLAAIRIAPNPARGHLNRGNVLLLQRNLSGALDAFRTALEYQPDYAGAYYNIGNALLGNRQFDEAVASYRSALEIKPDYAEVHCSLGVALKELGQFDSAINSFKRALEINPNLVEAHYSMGLALLGLKIFDHAMACFQTALKINPNLTEAHYGMGLALQDLCLFEGAMESYHRALEINPDYAEGYCGLCLAQKELGLLDGALANCRRALEIKPDFAEAHCNLGIILNELHQYESAISSCRRALEIKPDMAEAHCNLGNFLKNLGQFDGAEACFRRALEIDPGHSNARGGLLFTLNYTASHSPAHYLEQARQYGRVVSAKVGTRFTSWQCSAQPDRIRVGLVSGDLYKHPVGHFLEGLLTHIDSSCIELIAYPTHHIEDELTARIRPYFSEWHPLFGNSDQSAARMIHADGVHILIDVSGHTGHNRLPVFAWKPAPVQLTWLGLPTTTGVAEIDYVLGDPHAIPPEFDEHFSESVWRLPDSYLCLTVPDSSATVAALPARSNGYVTFGSFNNLTKMTDAVVAVWARILESVPNSRLLLKSRQLNDPATVAQTRQRFVACGIEPDRLILSGTFSSRDEHLAAYNRVDFALDTFPYPGVTTSAEALWMGVPVLSLRGNRFLSRTAESIAHNAGLPDWIAADEEEYVAKAVTFSSDLDMLAALRAVLREQVLASPLFDAPRFARNFEDALRGMWQCYQDGNESRGS
jgi:protein O-GlcNAc transferase